MEETAPPGELLNGDYLGEYQVVHLREQTPQWTSYLVQEPDRGGQRHALVATDPISAHAAPERLLAAVAPWGILAAPAHVQVESVGVHAGACYIVFADAAVYVSLRRIVAAEAVWPVFRCLSACQMLAFSLATAWNEGRLGHTRLTPDTVCVDPAGNLRILDLGLAQLRPAADSCHDDLRRDMRALAALVVFMLTGVEASPHDDLDDVHAHLPPSIGLLTRELCWEAGERRPSWEPIVRTLSRLVAREAYHLSRGFEVPAETASPHGHFGTPVRSCSETGVLPGRRPADTREQGAPRHGK